MSAANRRDPSARSRVGSAVRRLGTIGLALALAAAVACGGGSKKKPTTPGAGSGSGSTADPTGMNDTGDPTGDGVPTGGGGGGDTGGGGGGDMGGGGGGGDTGGGGGSDPVAAGEEPAPPPIVPPNLDISPEQARSEVDRHLRQARSMLAAAKPDPDGAIIEAKAALAVDGTNVDAQIAIAHAYYLKRLTDTAEVILDTLFTKRRSAVERNAYLFYVYGLVYDRNNDLVRAAAAYAKAVELDGNFASALVNHRRPPAPTTSSTATRSRPSRSLTGPLSRTDAATWSALGSAYRGQAADYDPGSANKNQLLGRAENAYKRALAANQSYGPAYYNLGLLYLDADPFPDGGGAMDTLVRLNKAKTYFDEYKNMPGVDLALYDERLKDVTKLIKREEKKRKKAGGG
jgi:tetratricopeptide (TPR) repeat protein